MTRTMLASRVWRMSLSLAVIGVVSVVIWPARGQQPTPRSVVPKIRTMAQGVRAPNLQPPQSVAANGPTIPRITSPVRSASAAQLPTSSEMLPAPPTVTAPIMNSSPVPTIPAPTLAPTAAPPPENYAEPGFAPPPGYAPPGFTPPPGFAPAQVPAAPPPTLQPGQNPPPTPVGPQGLLVSLSYVRQLALSNNKDLAVLEFAPQIAQTDIQSAEGVFRPVYGVRVGGTKQFNQVATEIQSLGSAADTLRQDTFTPLDGPNQIYSQQLFRTGTRIESGFGTNYLNVDPIGTLVLFNPYWNTSANTTIEQPLFRGRGPVATMAPIRVAQAVHCQSTHALRATINRVLRDVEIAYWTEYAAQRELASREMILQISTQTWQRESELLRLGQGTVPDVAQSEEQMETYRLAVIDAQNRLALAQRELRRTVGLHPGDQRLLCSAELPPAVLDDVDFHSGLSASMQRPELLAQQQAIQAARVEVERTGNLLAPDMALRLGHSSTGLDNRLDQSIGHMWGRFNTYSAGIVFRRSLGQPIEQAAHRRAQLTLCREQAQFANLEQQVQFELDAAYRNLSDARRMLEVQGRRREAAAKQLEARRALYIDGRASLLSQLDAESRYATDVIEEITTMLNYQRALAQWNYARGSFVQELVAFPDEAPAPAHAPVYAQPQNTVPAEPTLAPPQHSPTR